MSNQRQDQEIELELNTDDVIFLIKFFLSSSDQDDNDEVIINLTSVDIKSVDILDLLSNQTMNYIKMKIRESMKSEPDYDLFDFMLA